METTGRPRLRLVARLCLVGAVVWSAAVLVLGFTAPLYGEASSSSTGSDGAAGPTVERTLTLVEANGASAVVVLLVPLVVSLVVAALLWSGGGGARAVAWTLAVLLTVASVLALMSVGLVVLPVCVALLVACGSARASAYWDTGLGAPAR